MKVTTGSALYKFIARSCFRQRAPVGPCTFTRLCALFAAEDNVSLCGERCLRHGFHQKMTDWRASAMTTTAQARIEEDGAQAGGRKNLRLLAAVVLRRPGSASGHGSIRFGTCTTPTWEMWCRGRTPAPCSANFLCAALAARDQNRDHRASRLHTAVHCCWQVHVCL